MRRAILLAVLVGIVAAGPALVATQEATAEALRATAAETLINLVVPVDLVLAAPGTPLLVGGIRQGAGIGVGQSGNAAPPHGEVGSALVRPATPARRAGPWRRAGRRRRS